MRRGWRLVLAVVMVCGGLGASIDVVAYEARRRGYDVEALPNSEEYRWGKNGEYTSPLEAWFSIIKFTENGSWKGSELLRVDDNNCLLYTSDAADE